MPNTIPKDAIEIASKHVSDILKFAFTFDDSHKAVVVWDGDSDLSLVLTQAYRLALPKGTFIDFGANDRDAILAAFEPLSPKDLVVLIQSTSFRLDAYRIRIELFNRGLKVIEHPHLGRMCGQEGETYINSLAYDPQYFRGVGHSLKKKIDSATSCVITSEGEELVFPASFESAKINIGDYSAMKNAGGQYPIGEVFTESKELESVHGRAKISFFGDRTFTVNRPPVPITLIIEEGRVVATEDSTPEFDAVLSRIREDEGAVWVRELGLGLNRAFTQEKVVCDVGSFERMCGVHLSLGLKHLTYKKPNIKRKTAKHHVDVFLLTDTVTLDNDIIYQNGAWTNL